MNRCNAINSIISPRGNTAALKFTANTHIPSFCVFPFYFCCLWKQGTRLCLGKLSQTKERKIFHRKTPTCCSLSKSCECHVLRHSEWPWFESSLCVTNKARPPPQKKKRGEFLLNFDCVCFLSHISASLQLTFSQFPLSSCVCLSFSGTGRRVLGRVFPPLESWAQLVQGRTIHSLTNNHVIISSAYSECYCGSPKHTGYNSLILVQLLMKKLNTELKPSKMD